MSTKDIWKVLIMLAVSIAVVALYCFARVDLGMTQVQVNQTLARWEGNAWVFALVVWGQVILALIAGLAYRIWRYRAEQANARLAQE